MSNNVSLLENLHIRSVLADYYDWTRDKKLLHPHCPPLNPWFLRFCADQHDVAIHAPEKDATKIAYKSFICDTLGQFEFFCRAGYQFEIWPYSGQPYEQSRQMRADVYSNRHLWVYKTGEMEANHPMAEKSIQRGWLHNDVFRAVHDVAAHAWGSFGFGARGEEAAFHAHAAIYSKEAIPALAAETRLQSAWVLFGKHLQKDGGQIPRRGDADYIPLRQRQFPQQKAFAAPQLCCELK